MRLGSRLCTSHTDRIWTEEQSHIDGACMFAMMQVYPLASNCDTEPRGFSELILVPIQRLLGTDHLANRRVLSQTHKHSAWRQAKIRLMH